MAPDRIPDEVFTAAVTEATKRAVRAISSEDRRRSLGVGFLIGIAVACLIAIPSTYYVAHENDRHQRDTARHDSRENCRLITAIARVSTEQLAQRIPESARFKRESKSRLGLTPKAFDELIARQRHGEEKRLATYKAVATVNCTVAIQ